MISYCNDVARQYLICPICGKKLKKIMCVGLTGSAYKYTFNFECDSKFFIRTGGFLPSGSSTKCQQYVINPITSGYLNSVVSFDKKFNIKDYLDFLSE